MRIFPFLMLCILAFAGHRADAAVVPWGLYYNVPSDLKDVVVVAAGDMHYLALSRDGHVTAWGNNGSGQTNVPPDLTNAVGNAAGWLHSVAVRSDGTVTAWGDNYYHQCDVPAHLTNAISVAAGREHSVALRADGSITMWGDDSVGQLNVPPGVTNVVGISAFHNHTLVVLADGTVVAWGGGGPPVPAGLSEVIDVAAGEDHDAALLRDGTVVYWTTTNGPAQTGLSNAVAISHVGSSGYPTATTTIGRDGSVRSWPPSYGSPPAGWTNVSQVDGGLALIAEGAPYISAQPASVSCFLGNEVQLKASATGVLPLSFQWRHNGTNLPGGTNAVLFLANAQSEDAGSYALVASNAFGTATTAKAKLAVIDTPPFWIQPPTNQTAYVGKRIELRAQAGGSELVYQWQFLGQDIPGATNSVLIIESAREADSGPFSVTVTNRLGVLAGTVVLWVSPVVGWSPSAPYPPFGSTDIVSVASYTDSSGFYRGFCGVRRDGTAIAWDVYGHPLALPSYLTNLQTVVSGGLALKQDGTIVTFGVFRPPDSSNVVEIATRGYGLLANGTVITFGGSVPGLSNVVAIAASVAHALALKEDGTVVAWGDNSSGQTNVPVGLSNVVAIAADGNSSLALRSDGTVVGWGNGIAAQYLPLGLTNVIDIAAVNDIMGLALLSDGTVQQWPFPSQVPPVPAGLTNVVALWADGPYVLAGNVAPYLWLRPRNQALNATTTKTLRASAIGSAPLYYQWYFRGTALAGATNTALTLTNLQPANAGDYTITVTNAFGSTSTTITLAVPGVAPVLTSQPLSQTVQRGDTILLSVTSLGTAPISYQWQFQGVNISGGTNASLLLTNVQPTNSGIYRALLTNLYGFTISSNATVTVVIPLADALNTTGLVWTSSGDLPWFGQTLITHDGLEAAQSGRIVDSQMSLLQTVLIGPGNLSFWWKVSSEQYWDTLTFAMNGVAITNISGEVDWQQQTYTVPAGLQTLTWVYAKDGSTSVGQDTGWLDQVSYSGAGSPPLLGRASLVGNTFTTSLLTLNGKSYVLEYKNALADANWIPAVTNVGNGSMQVLIDTNATTASRFYHVRQTN